MGVVPIINENDTLTDEVGILAPVEENNLLIKFPGKQNWRQ